MKKNIHGFSLLEVITALAISLLIVKILLTIYLSIQKNHHFISAVHTIESNATAATSILSNEIKKAGYIGCPKLSSAFPIADYPSILFSTFNKIIGKKDRITIQYVDYPPATLTTDMREDSILYTSANVELNAGDYLLISDCKSAEIFKIKEISLLSEKVQKIISMIPLHKKYKKNAEVGEFNRDTYFISLASLLHPDGSPMYSLMKQNIYFEEEAFIEDVDEMHIRYQIKNQTGNKELSAEEVADWSELIGVAVDFKIGAGLIHKDWHMYTALEG